MVFYNTGQTYHGILTLEKGGTTVNYHGIFITLAPVIRNPYSKNERKTVADLLLCIIWKICYRYDAFEKNVCNNETF